MLALEYNFYQIQSLFGQFNLTISVFPFSRSVAHVLDSKAFANTPIAVIELLHIDVDMSAQVLPESRADGLRERTAPKVNGSSDPKEKDALNHDREEDSSTEKEPKTFGRTPDGTSELP